MQRETRSTRGRGTGGRRGRRGRGMQRDQSVEGGWGTCRARGGAEGTERGRGARAARGRGRGRLVVEEDAEERQARINRQVQVNEIYCSPFDVTSLTKIVLVVICNKWDFLQTLNT